MTEQVSKRSVFISYSRKDIEFVRKLNDSLDSSEIEAWVDWEGIPPSSDWMEDITRAVNGADAFLFVISPDSVASEVCGEELELGIKYNKKIIPILHRDPQKGTVMHEKLSSHNWVFMREHNNYDGGISKILESINTDLDWVRQHTRLLQRATEWERKNRNNSFLLQGTDLKDAEHWSAQAASHASREVLPLQAEYISSSRKAATKRQRTFLTGVSLAKGNLSLWDTSYLLARLNSIEFQEYVHKALFSPSNEWLVANTDAQLVWQFPANQVLNMTSADQGTAIMSAEALTYDLAIGPDSKFVIAGERENKRAILHNLGTKTTSLLNHGAKVLGVAFSPDNSLVATSGEDGKVSLWDVGSGECLFDLENPSSVFTVAFQPAGTNLSAGMRNQTIRWYTKRKEQVTELSQVREINAVTHSNDGIWLATTSSDGTIYVWNASKNYSDKPLILRLNGQPLAITFSPDNRWLAAGSSNGFAYLWDISIGEEVSRLPHSDAVTSVSFSKDGNLLATVSRKVVQFWDVPALPLVPTSELINVACSHLTANMSESEWNIIFPSEAYRLICPDLQVASN